MSKLISDIFNFYSQLTENEATVVDLIVRLATQMMALKLDFASYALLKAIRVFRDCEDAGLNIFRFNLVCPQMIDLTCQTNISSSQLMSSYKNVFIGP